MHIQFRVCERPDQGRTYPFDLLLPFVNCGAVVRKFAARSGTSGLGGKGLNV